MDNEISTLEYKRPMSIIPVEYDDIDQLIEEEDPDDKAVTEVEKLKKDEIALRWALNAEELQQTLYTKLDLSKIDPESSQESLISYEAFQKLHQFTDQPNADLIQAYSTLYTKKQIKKAKKTLNTILGLIKDQNPEAKTFKVAFIFIVYQLGNTDQCGLVPIIRVLRKEGDPEDEAWYVDQENRVYDRWKDFLDDNRLPKLRICYPKNGYYSVNDQGYSIYIPEERVVVKYGMTPASRLSKKILRTLDWATSGILIGTFGIAVAAALSAPISAPIITTAVVGSGIAAFYGASRSGATLVDRKMHAQSIGVKNAEARSCWIAIGSSIFSVSFSSATMLLHKVIALSHGITAGTMYTVNGLHTGALVFSGAGVANQSHHIGKKIYNRQRVTAFEVLELALSTFLFSNSIISFKTANLQLTDHSNHGGLDTGHGQATAGQAQGPGGQKTGSGVAGQGSGASATTTGSGSASAGPSASATGPSTASTGPSTASVGPSASTGAPSGPVTASAPPSGAQISTSSNVSASAQQVQAPSGVSSSAPTSAPAPSGVSVQPSASSAASAATAPAPSASSGVSSGVSAPAGAPSASPASAPAASSSSSSSAQASTSSQPSSSTVSALDPSHVNSTSLPNQSGHASTSSGSAGTSSSSQVHDVIHRIVNNVNADNVSDKHPRIARVLNAIQNPQEFFAKSFELTRQVNRLAKSVKHDKRAIEEKEAPADLISCSSETNLSMKSSGSMKSLTDDSSPIEYAKSYSGRFYQNKIEEILLNDYKFLAQLHLETVGIEEIRRFETRVNMSFYTFYTKNFTPELVKMCISAAKSTGQDEDYEFLDLCSCMKRIFEAYFAPVLKKQIPELEREIVNNLSNDQSKMYKDLMEELLLEFFRKLNNVNKYRFEDSKSAKTSYETYASLVKEVSEKPIPAKEFMKKVNQLFEECAPEDIDQISYKDRIWNKILHVSEGWQGVLYDFEGPPKERFVKEFGLVVVEESGSWFLNLEMPKIEVPGIFKSKKIAENGEKVVQDDEKVDKNDEISTTDTEKASENEENPLSEPSKPEKRPISKFRKVLLFKKDEDDPKEKSKSTEKEAHTQENAEQDIYGIELSTDKITRSQTFVLKRVFRTRKAKKSELEQSEDEEKSLETCPVVESKQSSSIFDKLRRKHKSKVEKDAPDTIEAIYKEEKQESESDIDDEIGISLVMDPDFEEEEEEKRTLKKEKWSLKRLFRIKKDDGTIKEIDEVSQSSEEVRKEAKEDKESSFKKMFQRKKSLEKEETIENEFSDEVSTEYASEKIPKKNFLNVFQKKEAREITIDDAVEMPEHENAETAPKESTKTRFLNVFQKKKEKPESPEEENKKEESTESLTSEKSPKEESKISKVFCRKHKIREFEEETIENPLPSEIFEEDSIIDKPDSSSSSIKNLFRRKKIEGTKGKIEEDGLETASINTETSESSKSSKAFSVKGIFRRKKEETKEVKENSIISENPPEDPGPREEPKRKFYREETTV